MKVPLGKYKSKVVEIQLVPPDLKQEEAFGKAEGSTVKVKGEIIEGEAAWYIREFGMLNVILVTSVDILKDR